ncbi:MAG: transposase [Bacteroidales bacterium]|nr:transposase [Bacteroidales bacterium]
MSKYKTTGKQTLFDAENSARKLSEMGNPLEKLDSVIDFEMFRSRLEASMVNHGTKSKAGAKQYDVVMMFKVMVLRQYYNLSYEQTEYQIIDRGSFKQFLGLASGDKVPDANTIRNFFEGLNFMEGAMHGLTVRTIGIARAATSIFLKCLTYNMFRYEQFVRNGIR